MAAYGMKRYTGNDCDWSEQPAVPLHLCNENDVSNFIQELSDKLTAEWTQDVDTRGALNALSPATNEFRSARLTSDDRNELLAVEDVEFGNILQSALVQMRFSLRRSVQKRREGRFNAALNSQLLMRDGFDIVTDWLTIRLEKIWDDDRCELGGLQTPLDDQPDAMQDVEQFAIEDYTSPNTQQGGNTLSTSVNRILSIVLHGFRDPVSKTIVLIMLLFLAMVALVFYLVGRNY